MRKLTGVLGTLLALSLVAAACGGDDSSTSGGTAGTSAGTNGSSPTTEESGAVGTTVATTGEAAESISIVLGSEPTSLDPHLVDDGGERAVNNNIYETLLFRTADGVLEPGLAVALPTQVDELTWEFSLREGVTFHDGTPFDSAAVVASIERMVRLIGAETTDNAGYFSPLARAEAVDPMTVRVLTSAPDGLLPSRMNWLRIVSADAAASDDITDAPNGTGPYRFVSREVGVAIELERNDAYWGAEPDVDAITFGFVPEAGTRIAGVQSGAYDLMVNLSANDREAVPNAAQVAGIEHPILILNTVEGITADVKVRQALNLAVDKQAIVDAIYGGGATVDAGQVLSETILGFNDSLEAFPYDPDQAKQLLEEAGVAGQTIQIIGESGRWVNDGDLLEAVASYWTAAGLQVDLQILEFSEWLDVFFDTESQPDVLFVSTSLDLLDPDKAATSIHSMNGLASGNDDAELAAMIDEARSELDANRRDELYQQIMASANEKAYFVWLVNTADIYGLGDRVTWTPRIDGLLLVKEMSVSG
ncbi:MAG: peptide/nickel transport system substrate-binding protein [Acidimicrobiaceae bacterium]|nr:MAG: peptide/nickel transport system substrate-binding protein [Acidimicrobiaceae bacterium]